MIYIFCVVWVLTVPKYIDIYIRIRLNVRPVGPGKAYISVRLSCRERERERERERA
jgi:hypothetical protein